MRKKLLTLSLLPVFLLADNSYSDGIKSFESKDYKSSYEIFNNLFQNDMLNAKVNYYLGRSAFELGLYEKALVAYERVLFEDENHQRVKLELSRVYIALDMREDAKALLNEVLDSNPPESVKENIKKLLAGIERKEAKSFFKIFVTAGFGYDSNINSNPGQDNLVDYLSNENGVDKDKVSADDEIGDGFAQANLNLRHIYDFGDKGSFYLTNSAMLYMQNYFDNDDFNVLYMSFSTGVGYSGKDYKVAMPIYYDKVIYADSSLIDSLAVVPRITYNLSKTLKSSIYSKLQKKYYAKDSDRGREADVFEGGLSFSKNLDSHFLSATLSYGFDKKIRTSKDTFVDRDIYTLKAGYYKNIASIDLSALYTYRKLKYDDLSSKKTNIKREDDYNSFYLGAGKKFDNLLLSLGYSYINSDSNYVPAKYDKSIYSLNVSFDY